MAFTHSRAHRDSNHAELKAAYESLHVDVCDTSMVGGGFGDFVTGIPGLNHIVEVKGEDGRLRPNQIRFQRDWRGPIRVVRTLDDVVAHVMEMRKLAARL